MDQGFRFKYIHLARAKSETSYEKKTNQISEIKNPPASKEEHIARKKKKKSLCIKFDYRLPRRSVCVCVNGMSRRNSHELK